MEGRRISKVPFLMTLRLVPRKAPSEHRRNVSNLICEWLKLVPMHDWLRYDLSINRLFLSNQIVISELFTFAPLRVTNTPRSSPHRFIQLQRWLNRSQTLMNYIVRYRLCLTMAYSRNAQITDRWLRGISHTLFERPELGKPAICPDLGRHPQNYRPPYRQRQTLALSWGANSSQKWLL